MFILNVLLYIILYFNVPIFLIGLLKKKSVNEWLNS